MNKQLLLIGGGGHCRSCIDVIESIGEYIVAGIIDVKENIGNEVLVYKVIGCDDDIPELVGKYRNVLISMGQIKDPKHRIRLYNEAMKYGAVFSAMISPFSHFSNHAVVAQGTILMHNCFINAGAEIGENSIVNTSAVIEHDVLIGNNCHVSTSSVINGSCVVRDNVFIGSNTTVMNNISICDNVVIGAGSVVKEDIFESGTYAGNPLRKIG